MEDFSCKLIDLCYFWCCTASLVCSNDCHGRPAPKRVQWGAHMWSNCPKAYKASSNVLKETVKSSKEKYK